MAAGPKWITVSGAASKEISVRAAAHGIKIIYLTCACSFHQTLAEHSSSVLQSRPQKQHRQSTSALCA